ncbi:MAG: hypothetical protein Q9157_006611 [Trypethelium eluteriae]
MRRRIRMLAQIRLALDIDIAGAMREEGGAQVVRVDCGASATATAAATTAAVVTAGIHHPPSSEAHRRRGQLRWRIRAVRGEVDARFAQDAAFAGRDEQLVAGGGDGEVEGVQGEAVRGSVQGEAAEEREAPGEEGAEEVEGQVDVFEFEGAEVVRLDGVAEEDFGEGPYVEFGHVCQGEVVHVLEAGELVV